MIDISTQLGPYSATALVIAIFVTASVAIHLVFHRWWRSCLIDEAYQSLGQIFGTAIGTMFALVFALVTIAIWQNYDRVDNAVGDEANTIHNIYRYLDAYPQSLREPTQNLVRTYLKRVVTCEWPQMRHAGEDPEARRLISEINARLVAYRPASQAELPLHTELLTQVSAYRALRHGRLLASRPYVDTSMWIALTIGSLTLMVYCGAWRVRDRGKHLFMSVSLGVSLGVVFFLLLAYSHPFAGPEAISPAPFQDLLDRNL